MTAKAGHPLACRAMRARHALSVGGAAAALALPIAPDALATPATNAIQVDDSSSDAPLSSAGQTDATCESTDATSGCTLRAAVELADRLSIESGQQLVVELPAGAYANTLAGGGSLKIAAGARVVVAGAGARQTAIDGGGVASAIYVEKLSSLALEGVTVRHGAAEFGGGVLAEAGAAVRIVDTTIAENEAAAGGGVFAAEPGAATPSGSGLSIVASTVAHNSAETVGGGVFAGNRQSNRIVNSTIAENAAGSAGGGVFAGQAGLVLAMDTLFDNSAKTGGGGNLAVEGAEVALHQTLIAEPAGSAGPGCQTLASHGASASPVSLEYNLDYPSTPAPAGEVDACGLAEAAHDGVGIDPRLEPSGLTDNGGQTDTVAPFGGYSPTPSPAVDAVPLERCGTPFAGEFEPAREDQRGSPRPDPNGPLTEPDCDIGAYEFAATIVTPTCSTPAPVEAGERIGVLCTIERSEGPFATGTVASLSLPASMTLDSATPSQGSCTGGDCRLGTIGAATVAIVLTPSASGTLAFSASDKERGDRTADVPVTVRIAAKPPAAAPRPRRCERRGELEIHIPGVGRLKIVSAVVYVNKRRERTVRARALRAAIYLRRLPERAFTIRIVARTASGRRLVGVSVYNACAVRTTSHGRLFR